MIAVSGYDGFLYSIGYLAGWIVALFVVAEPIKRLGKYTLSDALDAKFNSRGIQLMAAISALVVSMCYLIPQMVGAGALVTPLLGPAPLDRRGDGRHDRDHHRLRRRAWPPRRMCSSSRAGCCSSSPRFW
jgi:hypothetical protein